MTMLVIGATGGTGRCVVKNALRAGHEVTAFARTPQKITMQHQRLRVAQGDVLQSDAVLHAMQGQQAVICALGPAAGTAPGSIGPYGDLRMARGLVQPASSPLVARLLVTH